MDFIKVSRQTILWERQTNILLDDGVLNNVLAKDVSLQLRSQPSHVARQIWLLHTKTNAVVYNVTIVRYVNGAGRCIKFGLKSKVNYGSASFLKAEKLISLYCNVMFDN